MPTLLTNALLFGLLLSLVLLVIMAISLAIAPDMWVHDYPPDIRAKYGPRSAKASRARPFIAIPFFLAILVVPLLGLQRLAVLYATPLSFWQALGTAFLILFTFNLFDLLVLDWLVFVTLQPKAIVLPGTEGMPGYKDYRFHFEGFLKGILFSLLGGALLAGLWMLVQWLLG